MYASKDFQLEYFIYQNLKSDFSFFCKKKTTKKKGIDMPANRQANMKMITFQQTLLTHLHVKTY